MKTQTSHLAGITKKVVVYTLFNVSEAAQAGLVIGMNMAQLKRSGRLSLTTGISH